MRLAYWSSLVPYLLVFLPIPAYYFKINFSGFKLSIFYPMVYKGILWYSLLSKVFHCLQWYTKGIPIEYQRITNNKAIQMNTKGYKEYQRTKGPRNTKGPKDKEYQSGKQRKEKEALKPKSRLRPKKKKDWVFLFVALP